MLPCCGQRRSWRFPLTLSPPPIIIKTVESKNASPVRGCDVGILSCSTITFPQVKQKHGLTEGEPCGTLKFPEAGQPQVPPKKRGITEALGFSDPLFHLEHMHIFYVRHDGSFEKRSESAQSCPLPARFRKTPSRILSRPSPNDGILIFTPL